MALLEACVETLDEARAAEAGGAARIELCVNLAEQGTTPPDALLASCLSVLTIPVFAMVRPRGGSFVYTRAETRTMRAQVARARALGAHGIVTGALTEAGTVAEQAMRALVEAAMPLPTTFHRAFDATIDREASLEVLIPLGVKRVLTSGGAPTAAQGAAEIARLVRLAAGRLIVVAGGSIRAPNAAALVAATGATELHAHVTSVEQVAQLVRAVTPSH